MKLPVYISVFSQSDSSHPPPSTSLALFSSITVPPPSHGVSARIKLIKVTTMPDFLQTGRAKDHTLIIYVPTSIQMKITNHTLNKLQIFCHTLHTRKNCLPGFVSVQKVLSGALSIIVALRLICLIDFK